MKILVCHNYYQQAGGEYRVFQDEVRLLESYGHEVIRFTRHNDQIRHMQSWQLAARTIWNSAIYAELRALIHRERPDVVHMTNTFPLISPAAHYAAAAEQVPVVQSLHNYRLLCPRADLSRRGRVCEACIGKSFPWPAVLHGCYRESRPATIVASAMVGIHSMLNTWTKTVDRFIVPTEFTRGKYIAGGLPADRIVVKPNFLSRDPGVGSGRGGFAVFVGRLAPEKGIDTLLAAWERLPHDLSLKIIGDGPLDDLVRTAAAGAANIEWLGQRPFGQVLSIIGDAACLVVPSICYETFGLTAVEAFAKGTPVIASRAGAVREVVEDGVTGLHFQPGDPDDLARQVQRLLRDPETAVALGQAARRDYESKYTAEKNHDQLLQVYEAAACRQRELRSCEPSSGTRLMPAPETTAPAGSAGSQPFAWPAPVDLFGIPVTPTHYEEATGAILSAAEQGVPGVVSCHAVHAVVTTSRDASLRRMVKTFDMITPDGQPVRWALNLLHRAGLRDRVYGPDLMLALCRQASERGVSIYLYGGSPEVAEQLPDKLQARFPGLKVAGSESPPFRRLTPEEDQQVVERINSSGAGVVFIGLGCPKQDVFAFEHRHQIEGVQVCVGAAFDFRAGNKKSAPAWMQRRGLEWFYRLVQEPHRLWKRYLITNTQFVWMLFCAYLTPRRTSAGSRSWVAAGLRPFRALATGTIQFVRWMTRRLRMGASS